MRKRSVKKNKTSDENIVAALKDLPVPLKTFDNHDVYFEENKRNESIFDHISKQKHRLKISDIKAIPSILKDRNSLSKDVKKSVFRNYEGKRPKKNAKLKYIRIVTRKISTVKEVITTIYLLKNKNIAKNKKRR